MTPAAYPVVVGLDAPLEIARWRPLVQWILAIPHFLMVYVLGSVASIVYLMRDEYPPFSLE